MPKYDLHAIGTRTFTSNAPASTFDAMQKGVFKTKYRGVPLYKNPLDIGLYLTLIEHLQPKTIIEIGTMYGGSALWFADMLSNHRIPNFHIYSVDIKQISEVVDERITFLEGDAKNLGATLTDAMFETMEHPFLIIEDSSHMYPETYAVLDFFQARTISEDYLVVEDGIVSLLSDPAYELYQDGPNRALHDFMRDHPDIYEIDDDLCDFYGYNMTYCLNGWLCRK